MYGTVVIVLANVLYCAAHWDSMSKCQGGIMEGSYAAGPPKGYHSP